MKMLVPKTTEDDFVEGEIIRISPSEIETLKPLPIIKAIASRFKVIYADRIVKMSVTDAELQAVVERAIASGHDPFSTDFHWWKDGGQLIIMDHYAPLVAWAMEKDPFKVNQKVTEEGVGTLLNWIGTSVLIKDKDFQVYRELFTTIFTPMVSQGTDVLLAQEAADKFAMGKVGYIADAVVKYDEVYKQDQGQWKLIYGKTPKGWEPGVDRAKFRSFRKVIKIAYGVPSAFERAMRGRQVLERLQTAIAAPDHMLTAGSEVMERFHRLNEMASSIAPSSPEELEERVSLIRGAASPIKNDFIDPPKAPKTYPEQIFKIFQDVSVPDKSIIPLAERLTGKTYKEMGEKEIVMATMYAQYIPHLRGKMSLAERIKLIPVLSSLLEEGRDDYQLPELKEILEAHVRTATQPELVPTPE